MYNVACMVQFISIFVAFWGIGVIIRGKGGEKSDKMLVAVACVLVYCVGYMMELESTTMEAAIVATKTQYLGLPFATFFYTYFIMEYCQKKIPLVLKWAYVLYNALIMVCVFQCEHIHIYYKSLSFTEEGLFPHLIVERGMLYYIQIVVITVVFVSIFLKVLITMINMKEMRKKRSMALLFMACLVPMFSYILFLTDTTGAYDPVSAGMLIGIILLIYTIKRYQIFDVEGIAHENIIEEMDEAIVVADADYRLLSANPAAKKIWKELGYQVEDEQQIQDRVTSLFMTEDDVIQQNGRYYRKRISHIYDENKLVGYSALVLDITQSRMQMQRLEELREEADAANEAKSAFLANMSHEIRTPMNAIIGYSELILRESDNEQINRHAADIKVASGNLLSIINSILDISKIESGKLEIVDTQYELKVLLQDVVNVVNLPIQNKHLKFRIRVDENLPSVLYGDSIRILQILVNILNNAIKFTEAGSIMISVRGEPKSGHTQRLEWKVSDTGSGIRREDLEKVFGRFEQTDQYRNYGVEGTGLGLAISKSLVEAMEGSISVDSLYGKGSTFTITMKQRVIDDTPIGNVLLEELTRKNIKSDKIPFIAPMAQVLVVDDNQINLDVTYKYLKHFKIQADMADNGLDAISMVQDKKYDLIFMDQMMPEMDGVETVRRIREMERGGQTHICIIALTANAVGGAKEYMLANGFDGYISKPMSIGDLEQVLRQNLPLEYIEYYEVDGRSYQVMEEDERKILIPGIIEEEGMLHCQNNREQYLQILRAVWKYGPSQAGELERCLKEKDYERYIIEVHGLKSNALNIGAVELSNKAAAQEKAGKEERFSEIDEKGEEVLKDFRKLLQNLEEYFKEEPEKTEEDLNGSRETIGNILNAMDRGDMEEAAEQLDLLEIFSLDEELTREAGEIRELFEMGDYDTVRMRLKNLTE